MAEYNYACRHAYFTKETRRVLCDREPKPDFGDHRSVVHSMCAYQPPCPNTRVCGLTTGWEGCIKLRRAAEEAPQKRDEQEPEEKREERGEAESAAPKRRSKKRRSEGEETN